MDNLIKLSSVTQALRARDILRKNGIQSQVARIPAYNGRNNCGYGLKISKNVKEAVKILRENNIKVNGRALGDSF